MPKEGIITFFADWVINTLVFDDERLDHLETVLQKKITGVSVSIFPGKVASGN
jgi:hypothetical protein